MRTVSLKPLPESQFVCPACAGELRVVDWYIPGMRTLVDLSCERCNGEFYGDLPAGQGLYSPMLLEKGSGAVHDQRGVDWFATWLRDSYRDRTDGPIAFAVEKRRSIRKNVVLLNCLDCLYGHSLLKLLNAQYYIDRQPESDLIVIVPPFLSWMAPEGVAEIWTVDLPLRRGTQWNDWLAREIKSRVEDVEWVSLSNALSHPRSADYDIERFTKIVPFDLNSWSARLERPTVTFIWRSDRLWQISKSGLVRGGNQKQPDLIRELAEELQLSFPELDFAVAGLNGEVEESLPEWIEDLRFKSVDGARERLWCERYARSHVVIGVHGSSMLLPSGHAGSVVELINEDRWGNLTQDLLLRRTNDCRNTLFRYRFLPDSSQPATVARLVTSMLVKQDPFVQLMTADPDASA